MVTRKYRLRVIIDQQVFNRFSTDYCLRDFSAFVAYAVTAVMEMSQPYPCFMQPCSHAAIEISQPSQPMHPLQQWRYLSHAHASCACSHTAMEISQPSQPMQSLQQWRCLSDFMLMPILMLMLYAVMQPLQPFGLVIEISQPSQPTQPLQQWRCLSHAPMPMPMSCL